MVIFHRLRQVTPEEDGTQFEEESSGLARIIHKPSAAAPYL
jgi:hypothetical protein